MYFATFQSTIPSQVSTWTQWKNQESGKKFQSTIPSQVSTVKIKMVPAARMNFNPRYPRRYRRCNMSKQKFSLSISIHDTLAGIDIVAMLFFGSCNISIHDTLAGIDRDRQPGLWRHRHFNPRYPRRYRRRRWRRVCWIYYFNPRYPRRYRHYTEGMKCIL